MQTKVTLKKRGSEVDLALRWITDVLTWCQIPHFLLGETGDQIVNENVLEIDKLELGILDKEFSETTKRLFKTFLPDVNIEDHIVRLDKDGVPIELKIIRKHYGFFEHPDIVYYMADEYKIPNPWEKYWAVRNLVA